MAKEHIHQQKLLNPQQEKAVHFGSGPLLIIAGAGTGKTTVVTERIKYLITAGLAKPSEILALTFTEKAAFEMEERVDIAMPYGYTNMWIMTFHAFCERVLKQDAHHIGLDTKFRLLTDTDATFLLRSHIFDLGLDYFRPLGNPTKFVTGLLQHFSRLMDEDITPNQYMTWVKSQKNNAPIPSHLPKRGLGGVEEDKLEIKKWQELAWAYKKYAEIKIKASVMDFSNLIGNTLTLFRTRKNVLRHYQRQFKFLLVDEFQDTNKAQNELVRLLAGNAQNITVVADDDQSIYAFRGAAVSNVIRFRKHFRKSKLVVLSKNYRSTQTILDSAYQLIQHNNPDRLEVKEKINKKLFAVNEEKGESIGFLHANIIENETDLVVKKIVELKETHGYNFRDFAILVRANNHADPFIKALTHQRIPFQFLGPSHLFKQSIIKALIAYLQVLTNYQDSLAFLRVLSIDHFNIPQKDVTLLTNFAKRNLLSLFETTEKVIAAEQNMSLPKLSVSTITTLTQLVTLIETHLTRLKQESAGQLLFDFLEQTGMLKALFSYNDQVTEQNAMHVTQFFNKLKVFETEHDDVSVAAVLDWISLTMELGESPLVSNIDWTTNDAVNILTVHSAKGLEFAVVFMVNLVSQRFPTLERREQIPIPDELVKDELPEGDFHLEEERRLFYVGMTRAKSHLYFSAANFYGGKREKKISTFVYEALGKNSKTITLPTPAASQLSLLEWKIENKEASSIKRQASRVKVAYLSYSQIDTFKLCPLHYKLRYLLNVPAVTTPAIAFGSSLHATLKEFYQQVMQGSKVSQKLLLDLLKRNWSTQGYESKTYERANFKRGETYLRGFFDSSFNSKTKPLALELPFTLPIFNKHKQLKIGGRIDRVDDLGDGEIEIIDYKTGKLPSKRDVDTSLQLSFYALAATHIKDAPFGRSAEKIKLSLYYFDTQEKISTTRTTAQLAEEKARIFAIVSEIEQSDFACSGHLLCQNCEYKLFCKEA